MTEDEAKTKWCPFARTVMSNDPSLLEYPSSQPVGNRVLGPAGKEAFAKCMASECMAWRWIDTHVQNPAHPDGDLIRSTRSYGTCGLAGSWFPHKENLAP